jgi:hypothetical protein
MADDFDSQSALSALQRTRSDGQAFKSAVKENPFRKNSATSRTFPGYPFTTCALVALTTKESYK